jgi:hypothetical protein
MVESLMTPFPEGEIADTVAPGSFGGLSAAYPGRVTLSRRSVDKPQSRAPCVAV